MSLTVFISGGTSGLGKLTSKKLFNLGHTVIITGRTQIGLDEAEAFVSSNKQDGKLYKVLLNLSDFNSIQKAVKTIKSYVSYLDVIVHNAAGKYAQFEQRCNSKVESTIFSNSIAPLYLNRLLMPLLKKSASDSKRIIFLTSGLHDPGLSDTEDKKGPKAFIPKDVKIPGHLESNAEVWGSTESYTVSKLACIWNAFGLAERYPTYAVITFCPGFVPYTNLNRTESEEFRWFLRNKLVDQIEAVTEEESTNEYIYYITSPEINHLSGNYFQHMKVSQSSKDAQNKEKRELYWRFADELIQDELTRVM